jgi:hypothetical protein
MTNGRTVLYNNLFGMCKDLDLFFQPLPRDTGGKAPKMMLSYIPILALNFTGRVKAAV